MAANVLILRRGMTKCHANKLNDETSKAAKLARSLQSTTTSILLEGEALWNSVGLAKRSSFPARPAENAGAIGQKTPCAPVLFEVVFVASFGWTGLVGRPYTVTAEEIRWAQQRRSGGHSRGDQVGTAEEIRWAQQRRSGGHSKGDQVGKAEEIREMTSYQRWSEALHIRQAQAGILSLRL
eukprot:Em0009g799a